MITVWCDVLSQFETVFIEVFEIQSPPCPVSLTYEAGRETMKKRLIISIIITVFQIASIAKAWGQGVAGAATDRTAQLVVVVKGLKANQGQLKIALNNNSDTFLEDEAPAFKTASVVINGDIARFTFENIPIGDYAVTFFQDENDNDKLDTNLVGYPSEGFGFSNDPAFVFGPPSFDSAKISVETGETIITMNTK